MDHNEIASHLSDVYISFSAGVSHQSQNCQSNSIHKKDSKLDCCNNYHPISLLPNIKSILEQLVCDRVIRFLNDNRVIYPLQLNFGKDYSTHHALINLTEGIRKNLDECGVRWDIFVDLQKAFDLVNQYFMSKIRALWNMLRYKWLV